MVAIVTGNGLGLERTSGLVLGSQGQLGSAGFGRYGENVSVNAATGNLVIGRTDEILIGQGPDSVISRAYNSLGNFGGLDANDNWQLSNQRHVTGLTGTANTAGSTVTLVDWDGSDVTYAYNTTLGVYVSTEGAGAYNTLSFASGTDLWTWTNGSTQSTDTFDGANGGRLASSSDIDGNTLTYQYDSGHLTFVTATDASGVTAENTELTWSTGGELVSLKTTDKDGHALTRTQYGYDAQGRLSTVTTDLTPEDNSISDGVTVVTTYTYVDSTSRLISSISQTGGAQLDVTYDGSDRVASLSQTMATGITNTTTFSYGSGTTTVTDQQGQATTLTYDVDGQLTQIALPAAQSGATGQVIGFTYDADGNVLSATDASGNVTTYQYDGNGNATLVRDQAGNTITRTFDSTNHLLTETRYFTPDPDGAGSGLPNQSATTRYSYDSIGHLRFVVSSLGEATEYQYNSAGQQTSAIAYIGAKFDVSSLADNASTALGDLTTWTSNISNKSGVHRVDTTYDFRGNVSTVTTYSAADSSGAGLTTAPYKVVTYTYDQYGNLLTRHTSGVTNTEQFVYDGLGRLVGSTDLNGATTNVAFTDSQNKTIVALANGLVKTSVYNLAGELVSYAESGSGITTGTTSYAYDALGQLRMVTDATGNQTYYLYDNVGRKVADIAADGAITEYRYDQSDRLVSSTSYATRLTSTQLASLVSGGVPVDVALSSIRPSASTDDVWNWRVYDTANRLVETIDGNGSAVVFTYDGAANLVSTHVYANSLASGTVVGFKTTAPTSLQSPTADASHDIVTRNFYDNDGRLTGTLDGNGYLTQTVYDEAGEKIETITYANATAGDRVNDSFSALLSATTLSTADTHTRHFYDGAGQLKYVLDNSLRPTEYVYDNAGRVIHTIAYGASITSSATYDSGYVAGQISSQALLAHADTRISWAVYDGAGRVAYTVDALGDVVGFAYDAVGEVVKTTAYVTANSASSDPQFADMNTWASAHASDGGNRVTRMLYDQAGRVVYAIDAENYVTENRYDAAGRVTLNVRYASSGYSIGDTTTVSDLASQIGSIPSTAIQSSLVYDTDGRVVDSYDGAGICTHVVYDALGRVTDKTVAFGTSDAITTHYVYDAAGRVLSETDAYGAAEAATSSYTYDGLGNVLTRTDGRGHVTSYTYDSLGQALTVTTSIDCTTSVTVHNVYNAFGNVKQTTDARGNSTYYFYDDLGRLSYQVDAEGYVTHTTYAIGGEIASVTRYATKVADPSADPSGIATSSADATTTFTRDLLGRVIRATDAEGYYQQYTLDAFGNQVEVRNQLGGVTRNEFDRRGLLTLETTDKTTYLDAGQTVHATAVTNTFQYDARGNRIQMVEAAGLSEQRTTTYTYDKLNRLLTTTGDAVTVTDSALGTSTVTPTTTNVYDARGNLIEVIDPNNAKTFLYYDGLNRKVAVVNAVGTLSTWTYDANGNAVSQRVYDAAIGLPTTPGGSAPTAATGAIYRETAYEYDNANRLTKTVVHNVAYGSYSSSSYSWTTGDAEIITTYDENGNVTSQTDANGNTVYYYYDKRGLKVAQVDQGKYLTCYTLDADGNVAQEERFATALTSPFDTETSVSQLRADITNHDNDRVTTFTYDLNGRRLTEQRQGVDYYTVNGLTLSHVSGTSTITYTYNGLGEVTSKTEATGDQTSYAYDTYGRQTTITGATFKNQNGTDVTPTTAIYYDGLGDVTGTAVNSTNSTLLTVNAYGASGRLTSSTDAAGFVTHYGYDAAGHLVAQTYTRTRSDGSTVTEARQTGYDALGRAVRQQISTWTGTSWSAGDYTQTQYNAFGEVTATGANGLWQETTSYDNAGRAWMTTSGDGIVTLYYYDRNGNQTAEVTSDGTALASGYSWSSFSSSQLADLVQGAVGGAVRTYKTYDARGQNVSIVRPDRQLDDDTPPTTATITTLRSYNAFGEVTSDTDAKSAVTNYSYNALGKLIRTQTPTVGVTDEAGATVQTTTLQTNYYDRSGRLVGVEDALGNKNTRSLLAGTGYGGADAKVTAEYHPDQGVKTYGYDVNGNLITVTDELLNVTSMTYDAMGRVVQVNHPTRAASTVGNATGASQLLIDYYVYDELGQRTVHWTNVSTSSIKDRTDYDAQGRVIQTVDMLGHTTTTSYEWSSTIATDLDSGGSLGTFGGWVQTTSKKDSPTASAYVSSSQTVDYFNRNISKTDFGGNASGFTYNLAGQLANQTVSTDEHIEYRYYNTGALKEIKDITHTYSAGAPSHYYDEDTSTTEVSHSYTVNQAVQGTAYQVGQDSAGNPIYEYYDSAYEYFYTKETQTVGTETYYTSEVDKYETVERLTTFEYDVNGNRTHETATLTTTDSYATYYNAHVVTGTSYDYYTEHVGAGVTHTAHQYSNEVADYSPYTYYSDDFISEAYQYTDSQGNPIFSWTETGYTTVADDPTYYTYYTQQWVSDAYDHTDSYGQAVYHWPEVGYTTVQDPLTYYTYYSNDWISDAYAYTDANGQAVYHWPAVGYTTVQDPLTYYTYYTTDWVSEAYSYTDSYGQTIYSWPATGSYQAADPTTYHTEYYWVEDGSYYYDSCYGDTYFYDYGYGHNVGYQVADPTTYHTVYYNYTAYGYSDPGNYGHYTTVQHTDANPATYHTESYNYTAYGYSDPGNYGHYENVQHTAANPATYHTESYNYTAYGYSDPGDYGHYTTVPVTTQDPLTYHTATYYYTAYSSSDPHIGHYETVQHTGYQISGYHTVYGTNYTDDPWSYDVPTYAHSDAGTTTTDDPHYSEDHSASPVEVTLENESIGYDALNRVISIEDDGYHDGPISATPVAPISITIKYDANGNVRERLTHYVALGDDGTPNTNSQQDYWYKYDSMNRFVTTMGTMTSGVISHGTAGYDIQYDKAGNRVLQISAATGGDRYEKYQYTADGFLAEVDYSTDNVNFSSVAEYSLDEQGRATDYKEYGILNSSNTHAVLYERTASYDAIGQVSSDTVSRQMSGSSGTQSFVINGTYTYTDTNGHWLGGAMVSSHTTQSSGQGWSEPETDTVNTYVWRDSAILASTSYEADAEHTATIPGHWDPSGFNCWIPDQEVTIGNDTAWVTNYSYDAEGNLILADINDGQPRTITFINNQMGEVLKRDVLYDTQSAIGPHERHYYFQGQAIGDVTNNGTSKTDYVTSMAARNATTGGGYSFNPTVGRQAPNGYGPFAGGASTGSSYADFDQSYNPISGYDAQTTASNYSVRSGDTLTSIALALWGDASLWYLIAQANGIDATTLLQPGQSLVIPNNRVHNFHNSSSTISVYDPNTAFGDTAPTAPEIPPAPPPPPPAHHGGGCGIFGQIITAVIAIAVAIAAPYVAPAVFGTEGILGGGIVAGVAAGAVGGIVSQGVAVATGIQDSFNWSAVAMSAIGAGVGAGVGQLGIDTIASSATLGAVARGVIGSVAGQGIDVAVGLQKSFNWAGVAAAGIGAGVGSWVGQEVGYRTIAPIDDVHNDFLAGISGAASLVANAATRSLISGTDFGDNIMAALPDTIGQTVGNLVAGQYRYSGMASSIDALRQTNPESWAQKDRELIYGLQDARNAAGGPEEAGRIANSWLDNLASTADSGLATNIAEARKIVNGDLSGIISPQRVVSAIGSGGFGFETTEISATRLEWLNALGPLDPLAVWVGDKQGQLDAYLEKNPALSVAITAAGVGLAWATGGTSAVVGLGVGALAQKGGSALAASYLAGAGYDVETARTGGVGAATLATLALIPGVASLSRGIWVAEGASSPSMIARSLQGDEFYPGIDRFRDITLKRGTRVYVGEPGITGFATTRSGFARTGTDAQKIFRGLQVAPKNGTYRPGMTEYVITQDTRAAFGIVRANTQYGSGGLPQLYIPNFTDVTRPTVGYPLTNTITGALE